MRSLGKSLHFSGRILQLKVKVLQGAVGSAAGCCLLPRMAVLMQANIAFVQTARQHYIFSAGSFIKSAKLVKSLQWGTSEVVPCPDHGWGSKLS